MPIQCPSCGALNQNTARVCDQCGTSLRVAQEPGESSSPVVRAAPARTAPAMAVPPRPEVTAVKSEFPAAISPKKIGRSASRALAAFILWILGAFISSFFGIGYSLAVRDRHPELLPLVVLPAVFAVACWIVSYCLRRLSPRPWFRYFLAVTFALFLICVIGDVPDKPVIFFLGAFIHVVTAPMFAALTRNRYVGLVASLRSKEKAGKLTQFDHLIQRERDRNFVWTFGLARTDSQWKRLKGRDGLDLPVVEVECGARRLHGPPLTEESMVVVRGAKFRGTVRAQSLWNLTPDVRPSEIGDQRVFYGIVMEYTQPQRVPDPRYPTENRTLEVLTFRLRATDENFEELVDPELDGRAPSLPVEIRAEAIGGSLRNGDKVEIHATIRDQTIYARHVRNFSASGSSLLIKGWAGR